MLILSPLITSRLHSGALLASTVSKKSGRKRVREISWDDILQVITTLRIPDEECVTPEMFARVSETQKNYFLDRFHLLPMKESIMTKLLEETGMDPLPSPSNMTWKDALKFLLKTYFGGEEILMTNLPAAPIDSFKN